MEEKLNKYIEDVLTNNKKPNEKDLEILIYMFQNEPYVSYQNIAEELFKIRDKGANDKYYDVYEKALLSDLFNTFYDLSLEKDEITENYVNMRDYKEFKEDIERIFKEKLTGRNNFNRYLLTAPLRVRVLDELKKNDYKIQSYSEENYHKYLKYKNAKDVKKVKEKVLKDKTLTKMNKPRNVKHTLDFDTFKEYVDTYIKFKLASDYDLQYGKVNLDILSKKDESDVSLAKKAFITSLHSKENLYQDLDITTTSENLNPSREEVLKQRFKHIIRYSEEDVVKLANKLIDRIDKLSKEEIENDSKFESFLVKFYDDNNLANNKELTNKLTSFEKSYYNTFVLHNNLRGILNHNNIPEEDKIRLLLETGTDSLLHNHKFKLRDYLKNHLKNDKEKELFSKYETYLERYNSGDYKLMDKVAIKFSKKEMVNILERALESERSFYKHFTKPENNLKDYFEDRYKNYKEVQKSKSR